MSAVVVVAAFLSFFFSLALACTFTLNKAYLLVIAMVIGCFY